MRLPILHQVLVPIIAIQAVTIAAITVASAALAARRTERQIIGRLDGVILALGRSNFPLDGGCPDADARALRGAFCGLWTRRPPERGERAERI